MKRSICLMALVVAGLASSPAEAQFNMNLASQMALQRQTMLPMEGLRMRSLALRGSPGAAAAGRGFGPVGREAARGGVAFATGYRRDPGVSAAVRRDYLAFVRRTGGPGDAAKVEADFRRFDPVTVWTDVNRENGLAPGDMSDAMAAYFALNWYMANGRDLGAPQARALRREFKAQMAANPEVGRMSEAQRQAFAEALMCNFDYQQAAYIGALKAGDHALASRLGDAAEARFRAEMGIDLRGVVITPGGIAAR